MVKCDWNFNTIAPNKNNVVGEVCCLKFALIKLFQSNQVLGICILAKWPRISENINEIEQKMV